MSCRIHGGDFETAGQATRGLKEHLARIGVSAAAMRRAMIASYEAEMNVVIHARTGTLWARLDSDKLDLEVADEGPGIPDVALALREGWSTASEKAREMGFGAGMGLPNIRRNSDRFDIETRVGRGTRIRSTIFLAVHSNQAADATPSGDEASAGAALPAQPVSPDLLGIDAGRCSKCLRCIFACPTGALRVHADGPVLRAGLCVGCTACIEECAPGVFRLPESSDGTRSFSGAVLVLPMGFLAGAAGGVPAERAIKETLRSIGALGFTEVRFTEEWMEALRSQSRAAAAGRGSPILPLIPPVCPAVVALIETRFPSLISHLGPWLPPLEAAGEEFPLRPVFLLAPCPAQYASARGASLTARLTVLTPSFLREALHAASAPGALPSLRAPRREAPTAAGGATSGAARELSVTGPRHIMRALAEAEAGALSGVEILELSFCENGCSGSPLLSADPFMAGIASQRAAALLAASAPTDAGAVSRTAPYVRRPGLRLHPDMASAIHALGRIDELSRSLPGRDCGACGAPTCALFAEDIVMGRADSSCCPHTTPPRTPIQEVLS